MDDDVWMVPIDVLNDIYKVADRLRATAESYAKA